MESLGKTMMAWVMCFSVSIVKTMHKDLKKGLKQKEREIVKVEVVSCMMCDSHL